MQAYSILKNRNLFQALSLGFLAILIIGILAEKLWLVAIPIILVTASILVYNLRNLYWLLIASIPFSVTLDFSKSLSTDFPTEFLSIILTGIFWAIMLYRPSKEISNLWNSKVFGMLILLLLWSLVCALFAVHKTIAFKYCAAKVWYITAYIIVTYWIIRQIQDIRTIAWIVYVGIMITAIYSFIRTAIGGFNFEMTNQYSLPFYDNHVLYASIMSLWVPIIFVMRKWYPSGSLVRMLLNASIFFLLIAIYFSYTRACYLALIVGLGVYLAIRWRKVIITYSLAVILTVAMLFYFSKDYFYLRLAPDYNTTVMHNEFKDHVISTFYGKDASSMERLNMWVSVFRMYQERPIVGYGPNNFPFCYKPYSVLYFKTWVSDNPLNLSCHNYFWLMLAEQGLVGVILFVLFYGMLFYTCQRVYHQSAYQGHRDIVLAIGSSFGIFLVLLFFNDIVETVKNGSLFFILIAIVLKIQHWTERKSYEESALR